MQRGYSGEIIVKKTVTVGELVDLLNHVDRKALVFFYHSDTNELITQIQHIEDQVESEEEEAILISI